jgi:G3E family GTPase
MAKAHYIMVGGFLGAGKTTALLRLAERFRDQGKKVGLITNDQSVGLVDTAMLNSHDFPVQEITGGCFCCRFNSLTEAAEKLSATERPDIFLAEPVGSCTDLTATVSYPLRRLYGDSFRIAPFSVLVDPVRAERILGLARGNSFSPKVIYIYLKQLEEADVIVVNKIDTLEPERRERLIGALRANFADARVVAISARNGTNLVDWASLIEDTEQASGDSMLIDYDVYAEGEALLGWVNLTATLSAVASFDGNNFANRLLHQLRDGLHRANIEIAHLKATLAPDAGNDLAVVNVVGTDSEPESSHSLQESLDVGELIVNLRAEADPEKLESLLQGALKTVADQMGVTAEVEHVEAFRPGRPVPTHRDLQGSK